MSQFRVITCLLGAERWRQLNLRDARSNLGPCDLFFEKLIETGPRTLITSCNARGVQLLGKLDSQPFDIASFRCKK